MNDKSEPPSSLHLIGAGLGPWAMEPSAVTALLERGEQAFAQLKPANMNASPSALEGQRAQKHMKGQCLGVRDGVGILTIAGPLLKYESWLTSIFGLTTYEALRRDFQVAIDDPDIKALVLRVDTPGGEVSGCDELAKAIFDARGKKPITAFVSGMACSAGYWIASAANRIVVSESAMVGSIGVVMTLTDYSKSEEARGIKRVEFVSSKSPHKRPDVSTGEGAARVQKLVDDLGDVFVKAVAKQRGVTAQTVTSKYGGGGVEVGANAVANGAADEVGQFETVLAGLQRQIRSETKPLPPIRSTATMQAPALAIAPQPSAAEIARAAAEAEAQRQAKREEETRQAAAAEAARKAQIASMWKRAAEDVNAGLGPHAVKSAI